MSRKIYTINFPVGRPAPNHVEKFQCAGTVNRFYALPDGTCFLMGDDEEKVYQKIDNNNIAQLIPSDADGYIKIDANKLGNPWCEPLRKYD